jgi:hypothetical protein
MEKPKETEKKSPKKIIKREGYRPQKNGQKKPPKTPRRSS